MGQSIVNLVIGQLQEAGLRAAPAYPGSRIPHLTDVAVAVSLHKAERAVQSATVLVTVLSQANMGGLVCEPVALSAMEALEAMGGECTREGCQFDTTGDCFYIRIFAEFTGLDTQAGWESALPYTVKVGGTTMTYVTGFEAKQEMGKDDTSLANVPWSFTLEEMIPPGATEANPAAEPFTLSVSRGTTLDQFQNCIWTAIHRKESRNGTRQVRTGRAGIRQDAGVL